MQCSCATWWPNLQLMQVGPSGGQILKSVQVAPPCAQNLQTMEEASYGGKVFYLQMAGGAIQIIFLFLTFLGDTIMRTSTVLFHPIPMNHMSG